MTIDHCIYISTNYGAFVYFFPDPSAGQPNISIKNCYYNGQCSHEPVLKIGYCENLTLENLEGNLSNIGTNPEWFIAQCNVSIVACKTETATYSNNSSGRISAWQFSQCQVDIRIATFNGGIVNPNIGTKEISLIFLSDNLPFDTRPSAITINGATVGIDSGTVSNNLFLVGGNCQLSLGSASLRDGCSAHTAGVTIVANPFGV